MPTKVPQDVTAWKIAEALSYIEQGTIYSNWRFSASAYREELRKRFQVWQEITTPVLAA